MQKADTPGRYSPQYEYLVQRDQCLISLLYLSGRRISELVGRTYYYTRGPHEGEVDTYEGVTLADFEKDVIRGRDVLRMQCRILKKGRWSTEIKKATATINLRAADPLIKYVEQWLVWLMEHTENWDAPIFNISRQRCWQIITEIEPSINCHWHRHMRLTHLSETMSVYRLREFAHWQSIEPAVSYVHASPGGQLEAIEQADKLAGA